MAACRRRARGPRRPPTRARCPSCRCSTRRDPRQWVKNLLVFGAPAAAGVIFHLAVFARCAAAFADLRRGFGLDLSRQRHPRRRSGPPPPRQAAAPDRLRRAGAPVALVAAACLLAASLIGALLVSGAVLTGVVGAYVVISLAYSCGLKRVPVVEMACVGSGFVLRAVAGGAATHVPLSPWFLLVTSFGALFIVGGKRSSEHEALGEDRAVHRAALGEYPAGFLRTVRTVAASVVVTAYCLWAFDRYTHLSRGARAGISSGSSSPSSPSCSPCSPSSSPSNAGRGGAPEELALKDRTLQALGVAWIVLLLVGIYS